MAMDQEFCQSVPIQRATNIRYRGEGKVCFLPPLLSDQICKIVGPMFRKKKPAAGEKILRSLFFKKLMFLEKFIRF